MLTEKTSGYGYNGEYYDAATGMLNLRARQYEPAQGRFSQRDSLKGWATSPRSLNAYLYCQNDAINFFDASGAAMVAVNMTDGGGGRKSDTSPSSFFRKVGQTIKTAVTQAASSAATLVKQVNEKTDPTAKSKGEAIVVSGSKQTSKFAYNFIESGIKGIKTFKDQGQTNITWLVFSYLYSSDDLMNFETTASSLGVGFEVINSNQEFINYLNTGDKNTKEGVRDQKITNMVIYGHGKPGVMMLGNDDLSAEYLEKQLNGAAFDNAKTVLYTCRGANTNDKNISVAQTISNITQGETKAMNGRIDYKYIAYSKEQEKYKLFEKAGVLYEFISQFAIMQGFNPLPIKSLATLINEYRSKDVIAQERKETGYLQSGAIYDPIEGRKAWDWIPIEAWRPRSKWEEFLPEKRGGGGR